MLYIISTPIGNLEDITVRAIKVMSKCDYILSEDTRVSRILLNRYDIKTPLLSFHKFNEKKLLNKILKDLKSNKVIGLISDAGTPLISDPGENLIKNCFEKNLKVEALPGPCSIIQALVLSGFNTIPFQFLGFLPKKASELDFFIKKMLFYDGTSLALESARRILTTIEKIAKLSPDRNIAILKEMTKKFELRLSMKALEMVKYLKKHPLKGELVLAVDKGDIIDDIDIEDLVKLLQSLHGLSLKKAIKASSKIKNVSKKIAYKIFKVK